MELLNFKRGVTTLILGGLIISGCVSTDQENELNDDNEPIKTTWENAVKYCNSQGGMVPFAEELQFALSASVQQGNDLPTERIWVATRQNIDSTGFDVVFGQMKVTDVNGALQFNVILPGDSNFEEAAAIMCAYPRNEGAQDPEA